MIQVALLWKRLTHDLHAGMVFAVTDHPLKSFNGNYIITRIEHALLSPAGELRWVDEYGRIKVQFHWDRFGLLDETSSAWLRVMMPADRLEDTEMYLPTIGSEVVVDFIQGDPSLPIVLGSVYNGDQMPPLSLPINRNTTRASVVQEPISGSYKYLSFTTASHGGKRLKQSQIRRSKGSIGFA